MKTNSNSPNALKPLYAVAFAFLLSLQSIVYGVPSQTAKTTQESSAAKVGRLLKESGFNYKQVPTSSTIWTIDYSEKGSSSSFKVVLAIQEDLLVTFVVVAEKKNMRMSSDLMMKLLKFNHLLDRVKVGLDDDGDLFVRTDETIRILDIQDFKDNVDQVAAASSEVYSSIKEYMSGDTNPPSL